MNVFTGGRLVYLYPKKPGAITKCADTKKPLPGIRKARPKELKRRTKREKTVTRAYGGCVSAPALRKRILRAFLIEEQKIVVRVLKAQKARQSKDKPKSKK